MELPLPLSLPLPIIEASSLFLLPLAPVRPSASDARGFPKKFLMTQAMVTYLLSVLPHRAVRRSVSAAQKNSSKTTVTPRHAFSWQISVFSAWINLVFVNCFCKLGKKRFENSKVLLVRAGSRPPRTVITTQQRKRVGTNKALLHFKMTKRKI